MRIEDMGFSDRARNALLRNDIQTLEQLRKLSDRELLDLKNLGRVVLEEIRQKMPPENDSSLLVLGKWEPGSQPPLMPGEYIVYIKDARKATTLYRGDEHWYDEDGNWYDVLYWMEMPRLPKIREVAK